MGLPARRTPRRRWLVAVAVLAYLASLASAPAAAPTLPALIYLDPSYSPAERAADLVSRMTLAEKAAQMISSQAPAIPRLGVRAYGWWNEAIHGVSREQADTGGNPELLVNTTVYPVSLSLGSTWDPPLVYQVATAISDEAREVVRDNTLDLSFYSPTVNLSRDPRWGRNDETYSEDPLLTGAIAAQYVNGMQGLDPGGKPLAEGGGYRKTATTLKHYAANNSEANRRTGSSDMDERTLREYYTAPFREVIRRSEPAAIMTGYNEVNGVPASASVHLLRDLGRQTFGFTGYYTSDCDSIFEMQRGHHWIPPGSDAPVDPVRRSALANGAGVDLECQQGYHDEFNYGNTLPTAVAQRVPTELGAYTEDYLDASLVRLFATRIELGEFDDPGRVPWVRAARDRLSAHSWVNSDANNAVTQTPQRLKLAREAAAQSIVLLKNEPVAGSGELALPLRVPSRGAYRIAILGPAAQSEDMYFGGYTSMQAAAGKAKHVNVFDGLSAAVLAINPQATVDWLASPSAALSAYDVVVVYAATDATTAAEDTDRADLTLPDGQASLIAEAVKHNPRTVVYLETMGAVEVSAFAGQVPALLWSSYNGQRKGEALADVLLGTTNPSGHLPFTWYRDAGQLPPIEDYAIDGRTYQYFTGAASYAFGHGLSYTSFTYTGLRLDRGEVDADGTITASTTVTNTGSSPGAAAPQVYAVSPAGPRRPIKRLVGFHKVALQPGQSARLEFPLRVRDLAFFDESAGRYVVDNGRYELQLGESSADIRARASFTVGGSLTQTPAVVTVTPRASTDPPGGPGRVMTDPGALIEPQVTVAMIDDDRFGFLAPDRDRPLPPGMVVAFRSNRPGVVSIDGNGAIRAEAAGVATIAVTVTYQGGRASTSFVVLVR